MAAKTTTEAAAERLERARELVAAGDYLVTSGAVLVYSDAPGVPGYTVEAGRCTCADASAGYAFRHLGGRCKHVEAAAMVEEARAIARGTVRALRLLSSAPSLTLLERINQAAAVAQLKKMEVVYRTRAVPGYASSIRVTVEDLDAARPWDREVAIEDHLSNISQDILGRLHEDARP